MAKHHTQGPHSWPRPPPRRASPPRSRSPPLPASSSSDPYPLPQRFLPCLRTPCTRIVTLPQVNPSPSDPGHPHKRRCSSSSTGNATFLDTTANPKAHPCHLRQPPRFAPLAHPHLLPPPAARAASWDAPAASTVSAVTPHHLYSGELTRLMSKQGAPAQFAEHRLHCPCTTHVATPAMRSSARPASPTGP